MVIQWILLVNLNSIIMKIQLGGYFLNDNNLFYEIIINGNIDIWSNTE